MVEEAPWLLRTETARQLSAAARGEYLLQVEYLALLIVSATLKADNTEKLLIVLCSEHYILLSYRHSHSLAGGPSLQSSVTMYMVNALCKIVAVRYLYKTKDVSSAVLYFPKRAHTPPKLPINQ